MLIMNIVKLHASDNHWLTNYIPNKSDLESFDAFKDVTCSDIMAAQYYEITDDEYNMLCAQRDELIALEMENEDNIDGEE